MREKLSNKVETFEFLTRMIYTDCKRKANY